MFSQLLLLHLTTNCYEPYNIALKDEKKIDAENDKRQNSYKQLKRHFAKTSPEIGNIVRFVDRKLRV